MIVGHAIFMFDYSNPETENRKWETRKYANSTGNTLFGIFLGL
jgi:hypothetical protein